mgnify:CR=1 FL=1
MVFIKYENYAALRAVIGWQKLDFETINENWKRQKKANATRIDAESLEFFKKKISR